MKKQVKDQVKDIKVIGLPMVTVRDGKSAMSKAWVIELSLDGKQTAYWSDMLNFWVPISCGGHAKYWVDKNEAEVYLLLGKGDMVKRGVCSAKELGGE